MIYTIESKPIGKDANGDTVIWVSLEVDSIADLPAQNVFTGYSLCMGSKAHCIQDNSYHKIDSTGTWIQQQAGTSTYTRAEIDTMLANYATIARVWGQGIEIPENANLFTDNYLVVGTYHSPNAARTATLQNCPFTGSGFRMRVDGLSATNKRLFIFPISDGTQGTRIYSCCHTTRGYTNWYYYEGVQV